MLYPNGQRVLTSMGRPIAGALAQSGALGYGGLKGARLNRFVSDVHLKIASVPNGYTGKAYSFAIKPGGIAMVSGLSLSPTASGALGLNGVVSIPMSVDFSQASMGLVSQGVASITFSITPTASLRGVLSGSANFTGLAFSLPSPTIGALSGLGVTMPMSINVIPVLTAKAYMSASITNEGAAVTPTSVAAEVWNTVAAAFNTAGTMGAKMNSAASAGDPWTTLLPGAYGAGSAGVIIGTLANTINTHTTSELADIDGEVDRLAFGGAVHVNQATGTTGTAFPLGTAGHPVNNLADARAIAYANGFDTYHLSGDFVLDDAFSFATLRGGTGFTADSIDLNLKVLTSCNIQNMTVTGTLGAASNGANVFKDCYLQDTYQMKGEIQHGRMEADCYIYPGAELSMVGTVVEGDFTNIDLGSTTGTVFSGDVASGSILFTNAVAGCLIELNISGGDITLDATCTGGEYWIEGYGVFYNESTMTLKGNQLMTVGEGGLVAADVKQMNGYTVTGTGQEADPWRASGVSV